MVVTFFGTKGGTGTTTLAVNCAADLRRLTGRPTIVVDLKAGPGDVAVFLGLRPRLTMLDLMDQLPWLDRQLVQRFVAEHDCGLQVLAAADEFGRPAPRDAEAVEQALRLLSGTYAYVVVDAGATLNACAAAALHAADHVLLVANPDVPCLRNLQRLIDAVRLAGVVSERVKVVLNRASEHGVLAVGQIERVLGRAIDFSVPSDYRTVAAAINTGVPVSCLRGGDLQLQLAAMARAIAGSELAAVS
ncbi:MAG: AAA family ATPase [Acidobacteriota bacterium]